jgi:hypothetical protein
MSDPIFRQLPLSDYEIQAFAREWYQKLDQHAPADELVVMVAPDGMSYYEERQFSPPIADRIFDLVQAPPLEFVLPEGTLTGVAAFRSWYEGVARIFFDEVHVLNRVEVSWEGARSPVKVIVNWQARRWSPPAPRSQWIGFDADQDWVMVRNAETGRPVILRYVVNALNPMPGSPPL